MVVSLMNLDEMNHDDWLTQPGSITVTHVLQHLYCPRFTYFEHVLEIPQREELRWKVRKGRLIHLHRSKINRSYLRKKIGVVERAFDIPLANEQLQVRGVADEVLTFDDGTMGPLDYKFAKAPRKPFRNQTIQCTLYGMMIEATFGRPVNRGYLCYTRDHYRIVEVQIGARQRVAAKRAVEEIFAVVQQGYLPKATDRPARCGDCCYRNICLK